MTFKNWRQYFEARTDHFDHIDFSGEIELSGYEEKTVKSALQQFQKGENSDGKHLMQLSKKMGDENYTKAIKGLINEEQNHALVLGKFMQQENIATINEHWLDGIFKRIIKTPSLTLTIMVLLAAEIVAEIFYDALQKATNSKTLKAICSQILIDEEMHINFQIDALRNNYHQLNILQRFVFRNAIVAIIFGTTFIVTFQYKKVFKAGGYGWFGTASSILKSFFKIYLIITSKAPFYNTYKNNSYAN